MLANYFKIAWRNLIRNKLYATLNIIGLGTGMAIAIFTGIWLKNELTANQYHSSYDRIALLQTNKQYNDEIITETSNPIPLGQLLKEKFPSDFEEVVVSSYGGERALRFEENSTIKRGFFMQQGGKEILDLNLTEGEINAPLDPSSIYISEAVNNALFGENSGIGKVITIDENVEAKIVGIFKRPPINSRFRSVSFVAPFKLFENMAPWVRNSVEDWTSNAFPIYIKIAEGRNMDEISAKVKDVLFERTNDSSKPELFLHPMSKWHLYPEFKNGIAIGTGMKNVWLFGVIGAFILLLASINFMNLSTARAAKRAKEIGVRKTLGSNKIQLVKQFYGETFLVVILAGILSLSLLSFLVDGYEKVLNVSMFIPWGDPIFWFLLLTFMAVTGFMTGSYPAFYLSSFDTIKTLKGKNVGGKRESNARQLLVIFQFTISIALIIGTVVVHQQINFGNNRPLGYEQDNLVYLWKRSSNLKRNFRPIREALLQSSAVIEVAESSGPIDEMFFSDADLRWEGKNPTKNENFTILGVNPEFGQTIQWEIIKGRDFDRSRISDNESVVINETAANLMAFDTPIGQTIRRGNNQFQIIGVSKDFVMDSPFESIKPTLFAMQNRSLPFINMRLNPGMSASASIKKIKSVLSEFSPNEEFNIKFADEQFHQKFWKEKREVNLATALAVIAVFISLLGTFGLASFMTEQREKEIGIRKILGASVLNIIQIMTSRFVILTACSCLLAFPIAYFYMLNWLSKYELKINLTWEVFGLVGISMILITVLTVGTRSFGAATINPVESLRNE